VEGPIGVGKTSLAKRLAETFGSELILEDAASNPFLNQFYKNPDQSALPTQLFFLFQRAQQMQELRQDDMFTPVRVADFLLDKDQLFAELTLDSHELDLYQQIYDKLEIDPPVPDLVIYLQAPVNTLKQRIQNRGIRYEQTIGNNYLNKLVEAYSRFFHDYQESPLLIVNATQIDLVNNDQHYQALVERILEVDCGRNYFNLLPSMI
jgi:deoxyadenosine/deoxycytidine kinase